MSRIDEPIRPDVVVGKDGRPEIKFPTQWEFRIIADAAATETVRPACRAVLESHDPGMELTDGGFSKGKRYFALRAVAVVFDRDDLNALSAELTKVPGVKMLL